MAAKTGERARASGTFHCDKCGQAVRVRQGSLIPACPDCGNDSFGSRTQETSKARMPSGKTHDTAGSRGRGPTKKAASSRGKQAAKKPARASKQVKAQSGSKTSKAPKSRTPAAKKAAASKSKRGE